MKRHIINLAARAAIIAGASDLAEQERLRREWAESQIMTTDPLSFEAWLEQRKKWQGERNG